MNTIATTITNNKKYKKQHSTNVKVKHTLLDSRGRTSALALQGRSSSYGARWRAILLLLLLLLLLLISRRRLLLLLLISTNSNARRTLRGNQAHTSALALQEKSSSLHSLYIYTQIHIYIYDCIYTYLYRYTIFPPCWTVGGVPAL